MEKEAYEEVEAKEEEDEGKVSEQKFCIWIFLLDLHWITTRFSVVR